MSSYINIYLKLKDSEDKKLLKSYGRSMEMYDVISDICNPQTSYEEIQYTEITADNIADMKYEVQKHIKSYNEEKKMDKKKFEKTSQILSEAFCTTIVKNENNKNLNKDIINNFRKEIEEAWNETHSSDSTYKEELKETLNEINGLESLMVDISLGYSDFDKIFCSLT